MIDEPVLLFIIPAITSVIAYGLIRLIAVIPKSLMNPVVLPVLGIGVNWLLMVSASVGVDPLLAAVLGATASAMQKAIEHIRGLVTALRKGDGVPIVSQ